MLYLLLESHEKVIKIDSLENAGNLLCSPSFSENVFNIQFRRHDCIIAVTS